jgi:hypothetical protein
VPSTPGTPVRSFVVENQGIIVGLAWAGRPSLDPEQFRSVPRIPAHPPW